MLPEKQSVIESEPLTDETEEKLPSAEGKKPSKTSGDDRPEINKASEVLRKENQELKRQMEEFKNLAEDRLAQLEEKTRLTADEKDEQSLLKRKIAEIRANPEAKVWLELTKEVSQTEGQSIAQKEILKYDYNQAMKMIKREARSLKVEEADLQKEIFDVLQGNRWSNFMPTEKVELALDEIRSQKETKKKLQEADEAKVQYAEGQGRTPRSGKSASEDIKKAREAGDFKGLLATIASKQAGS